jgi:hypothetical protein
MLCDGILLTRRLAANGFLPAHQRTYANELNHASLSVYDFDFIDRKNRTRQFFDRVYLFMFSLLVVITGAYSGVFFTGGFPCSQHPTPEKKKF